jgi:basic amino acid/polyamine antiporter, APA family
MDEVRARPLGFPSLLALGINGIVGVGIFFAPKELAAKVPGTAGALVFLLTALALLPIALGYAALGRRFAVDGGPYIWAEAAFGPRFAFFVGWIAYASSLFSLAAVVTGFAGLAGPVFGVTSPAAVRGFAVLCVVALASVAASGLRLSAMVWTGVTVLKLVPLVLLVLVGVAASGRMEVEVSATAAVATPAAIARAALLVVFAFQGFEIVPLLAGSVRPNWAVPWATVSSLVFAAILYTALHALAVRAVPTLALSPRPLVDAARAYGGVAVADVVATGAIISSLGIAFGMVNTTPRYLAALSGPGAFGTWIGASDMRFVPQRALWLTTLAVVVLVSATRQLSALFVLSSLAVLAQYGAALTSLGVLSWRGDRGFSRRALWLLPPSLLGVALAARGAEPREFVVAGAVLAAGEGIRRVAERRRSES